MPSAYRIAYQHERTRTFPDFGRAAGTHPLLRRRSCATRTAERENPRLRHNRLCRQPFKAAWARGGRIEAYRPGMLECSMKAGFKLVIGSAVAIALMVVAVTLWTRNLIVFAAPLGVASVGAGWVTFDNQFVYGRRRTRGTIDGVS